MQSLHHDWVTSRLRTWVVLLAGLITFVVLVIFLTHKREPTYSGKPLSDWLQIANSRGDESDEAWDALASIGTNAIPLLLSWTEQSPSRWSSELLRLRDSEFGRGWKWIPLWATGYETQNRNEIAWLGFRALGEQAVPAIPELTVMARSSERWLSTRGTFALESIGVPAIPALVGILGDTNAPSAARAHATHALSELAYPAKLTGTLGGKADIAVLPLIENLKDSDELVARLAAETLGTLGLQPELCVPPLVSALQHSSVDLRYAAARALGSYGGRARTAVPILLSAVREDREIREPAITALLIIQPEALNSVRDTLVAALSDSDNTIQVAATNALRVIDPEVLTSTLAQ